MTGSRRVLVLAAHPDDEVLGCGGTMARLAREGHRVYIAILGEGATSRYVERGDAGEDVLESLRAQARRAAELVGAQDVFFSGLPDNRFDTVPLLEIIKIVEDLIGRIRPAAVYTQHGGDLNIDHLALFRATLTATRPQAGHPVRDVYAYEVASSSEWSFDQFAPLFRPNVFVDIGATLDVKVKAMQLYETEIRRFPHPRSTEALEAIAHRWGSVAGVEAAEAFQLVRSVRSGSV